MSKAFTREDDAGDEPLVPPRPPTTGAVRLTRGALAALREEVARTDDPARRQRVAEALQRAVVVPEEAQAPARVVLGARVTVASDAQGAREESLVSPEEFELTGAGCSVASPVGRALLGAAVGDEVEIDRPRGRITLRVVAIGV